MICVQIAFWVISAVVAGLALWNLWDALGP